MLEQLSKQRRWGAAVAILVAVVTWTTGMAALVLASEGDAGRWQLTCALAFVVFLPAMGFIPFGVAFPVGAVKAPLDQVASLAAEIARSSVRVGPIVCGGRIGCIYYQGPLLRIRVHSQGVVIDPVLSPRIPLRSRELSVPVRKDGLVFHRLSFPHTSAMVREPVELIFYRTRDRDKIHEALSGERAG